MEDLIKEIIKFRDERDWRRFHTPENLAKSISIEAAELLENFQWNSSYSEEEVSEELADVFIYCVLMADALNVDIQKIAYNKLAINMQKYPISKSRGNSIKYTEF